MQSSIDPTGEDRTDPYQSDQTQLHNGIANFIGAIQGGAEAEDDAWAALDDSEQLRQQEYIAEAAYNAAWKEATTLADGASIVSTDTPSSSENLNGVQIAAYSASDAWLLVTQNFATFKKAIGYIAIVATLVDIGNSAYYAYIQKNTVSSMRNMENNYEAGREGDFSQERQLIQDAQLGAAQATGKAGSKIFKQIYTNP